MTDYLRRIHYHETDKMGITHHANYIKFMEEARIHFLDELGFGYVKLEEDGIISPVVGAECQYKHPTTFDDTLRIHVIIEEFRSVKLTIEYSMYNDRTGELVLTGKTMHCFVDKKNRPIILKKQFPAFDSALKAYMEKSKSD